MLFTINTTEMKSRVVEILLNVLFICLIHFSISEDVIIDNLVYCEDYTMSTNVYSI